MSSRRFNKRIEVWQTTSADDGYGGNTLTDSIITTTWAEIKTQDGQSVTDLGLDYTKGVLLITVRKRDDLDYNSTAIYIKYKDVKYTITTFPIDENFIGSYISFIAVQDKPSTFTVYSEING